MLARRQLNSSHGQGARLPVQADNAAAAPEPREELKCFFIEGLAATINSARRSDEPTQQQAAAGSALKTHRMPGSGSQDCWMAGVCGVVSADCACADACKRARVCVCMCLNVCVCVCA